MKDKREWEKLVGYQRAGHEPEEIEPMISLEGMTLIEVTRLFRVN